MSGAEKFDQNAPGQLGHGETTEERLMRACRDAGMYPRNLAFVVKEFLRGGSYIDVAFRTGVSKNTVMRISQIGLQVGIRRLCQCDRLLGHKGWCKFKLAQSMYGGKYRGARFKKAEKPAYLIEIEKATARIFPIELRDEVRNDLVVQYLASELAEEQFTSAAEEIRTRLNREKYRSVSLDDYVLGSDRVRIIETMPNDQDMEGLSQLLSGLKGGR